MDSLPKSEYEKIEKLGRFIDKELDENPEMTEEDANSLILKIDSDTVNKHGIRIKFSKNFKNLRSAFHSVSGLGQVIIGHRY